MNASASFLTSTGREAAVILRGESTTVTQPVHLIFVIDISDSMHDSGKLESVKRSMEFVIPLLTPNDMVSVITFGEQSEVILNKVQASESQTILYKIRSLRTDGCTNMSAGLMNIGACLADSPQTHKMGVLLLTDGHANRGISSQDGLKQIVQRLLITTPSLTLTTVGYGHDHSSELLREMATTGAGSYNIVYTLENVATTFGEVVGGLTTVVAQNTVVHFPPESQVRTGYATTTSADGTIQVRIGDIYAENEIIILATLPPLAASVRVTGHNMLTLAAVEQIIPVLPSSSDTIPKNVEQAMFRYRVSKLLKEASVPMVDTTQMKAQAQTLLDELKELAYADELLIQMMIDDMRSLITTLSGPPSRMNLNETTSQMAQHSAYLALGRGMRSIGVPLRSYAASAHGSDEEEEPTNVTQQHAALSAVASPFMNRAQRRVTQQMQMSSQQ